MSVLTKEDIKVRMKREAFDERLIVTPLFSPEDSIDTSSIDVRLGNQFILMQPQSFPSLDIGGKEKLSEHIDKYQHRIIKRYHEKFILHPQQLVIGCTLEYIQIPKGLMCYVIGKSSWGRMGLIIATATKVDPGFKGCITLEIINEGEVPLVLYPGIPIAQLVIHDSTGSETYDGKYNCPIGPEFPKFQKSKDQNFWTNKPSSK